MIEIVMYLDWWNESQHSSTAFALTDFLKITLNFAVLFNRNQTTAADRLQWGLFIPQIDLPVLTNRRDESKAQVFYYNISIHLW